jgi:type IV pilus assembly protein PilM
MAAVTLVGLDVASTSIRAAETSRGKDGPVVVNFGQAALPDGAVQGGVVQDDKAVTAALKQLWATAKFRSRKVVLGVTNAQAVVRELTVSNLPDRELRRSLPFQVRNALPLPVEASILDFHPLEDPGQQETVRGLLIAAPKDAVLTAVEAIERAGLHVLRVDLASFALLRAVARLDSQVEAIVDIGSRTTTVVVHTDGTPLIVRTIPRGGAEATERIARSLGVSLEEAEAVKRRVGLRRDAAPDVAVAIEDSVRPLINEIRSSFTYLITGDRPTQVTRLALSGGGALLPGLAEALGTALTVEVIGVDPTMRVRDGRQRDGDDPGFRSSAAVSIGLTLGATR